MTPLDVAVMACPHPQGDCLALGQDDIIVLRDIAAEHLALVAEPLDGPAQFEPQLVQIGAADAAETGRPRGPETPARGPGGESAILDQGADDGQMIAGTGHPEDRRLAPRGVGAYQVRQPIE